MFSNLAHSITTLTSVCCTLPATFKGTTFHICSTMPFSTLNSHSSFYAFSSRISHLSDIVMYKRLLNDACVIFASKLCTVIDVVDDWFRARVMFKRYRSAALLEPRY